MDQPLASNTEKELQSLRLELARKAREIETLQRQIAANDAKQQELDTLKTNFVALVSHELRTPVAVLNGFLEVGLEEIAPLLPEEQNQYLKTALRNAQRLSRIVQELTDFSRYESRVQVENTAPLSVQVAIDQVLLILKPALDTKNLQPEAILSAEIGGLEFDGETLVIIFRNLLSNAAKFTDAGGRMWLTSQVLNGEGIIGVHDTASPIPPEKRDIIFEDFRQLENHLTRRYEGLGLGLALARRAARTLGGELKLEVRGEEGNSFLLTLPFPENN